MCNSLIELNIKLRFLECMPGLQNVIIWNHNNLFIFGMASMNFTTKNEGDRLSEHK